MGEYFVWEEHCQILGFAALGESQEEEDESDLNTELFAIYLMPEFYGTGKGSHFWSEIENDFKGKCISLWVFKANALGRRFYEKNGFSLSPDKEKNYHWRGFQFPEVRYRKTLAQPGGADNS